MFAIELEASIKDHRLVVESHCLPDHADHARVIVLFSEQTQDAKSPSLAELRLNPVKVSRAEPMKRDEIHAR